MAPVITTKEPTEPKATSMVFNGWVSNPTVPGLTPDIRDDSCGSLDGWSLDIGGSADITIDGGYKIDSGLIDSQYSPSMQRILVKATPTQYTFEVIINNTLLVEQSLGQGSYLNYIRRVLITEAWHAFTLEPYFNSDGLWIKDWDDMTNPTYPDKFVADCVQQGVDQTYRFQVDGSSIPFSIETYLDNVLIGTTLLYGSINVPSMLDKLLLFGRGVNNLSNNPTTIIKSIKIGTGLGPFGGSTSVITRLGTCYIEGSTGTPTVDDTCVYTDITGVDGILFWNLATGLKPNTFYRVRAYSLYIGGVSYGDPMTVKTSTQEVNRSVKKQLVAGQFSAIKRPDDSNYWKNPFFKG